MPLVGSDGSKALDKLKQDLVQHIDQRHYEMRAAQEALFNKLLTELKGNASGVLDVDDRLLIHSEPQNLLDCCLNPSNEHDNGAIEEVSSQGEILRYTSKVPGTQADKYLSIQAQQVLSASNQNTPRLQPDSGTGKEQSNGGPKANYQMNRCSTSSLVDLSGARGTFKGRDNLLAFLKCENWDSDTAQEPWTFVEETEEERSNHSMWTWVKSVINSNGFDVLIGAVILMNAIVMGLELEWQGQQSADKLGLERDDGDWPNAKEAFLVLEHTFTIVYLVELILRLAVMGCAYFRSALDWVDFVVVVCSCLELYIFVWLNVDAPDMAIVRLMRMFRIARVLRILRAFKFLSQLRDLVVAVTNSIASLFWSLVLLGIVQVMGSIFITQSLQHYLQDESEDVDVRKQVYTYFGNWSRSFITMFEISIWGGTWGRCGRVVIFDVSRNYAIFFIGYLALVSFAMIRVISALFLKDTLASAAKDRTKAMEIENRDPQYIKKIWTLFKDLDVNNNDELSIRELYSVVKDESACERFKEIGVMPQDVPAVFQLMDDGDDTVSFCEFISGIMRLKNASKPVDLATILYENKKILKRIITLTNMESKWHDVNELHR